MIPESYLMHYGTKGMKWGISNSKYYKAVGTPAGTNADTKNKVSKPVISKSYLVTSARTAISNKYPKTVGQATKTNNSYTGNKVLNKSVTNTTSKPHTVGREGNTSTLLPYSDSVSTKDMFNGLFIDTLPSRLSSLANNGKYGKTGSDADGWTYYDKNGNPIYWEQVSYDDAGKRHSTYIMTEKAYQLYGVPTMQQILGTPLSALTKSTSKAASYVSKIL